LLEDAAFPAFPVPTALVIIKLLFLLL